MSAGTGGYPPAESHFDAPITEGWDGLWCKACGRSDPLGICCTRCINGRPDVYPRDEG